MWKAFQRYKALDPQARALFRRAVFLMLRVTVSLHVCGFKKTQRALQKELSAMVACESPNGNGDTERGVQTTCRMVRAGARYSLVRPTCLVESLTLWYLLRRLSRLVRQVPVRRVVAHTDGEKLGALCECIFEDSEKVLKHT